MKQIANREEVWGLYANGWALAADAGGADVLPFWPAEEYARLCAAGPWLGYEFLECLTRLEADGVLPSVFYTPHDQGVTPSHEQLHRDVLSELERYE